MQLSCNLQDTLEFEEEDDLLHGISKDDLAREREFAMDEYEKERRSGPYQPYNPGVRPPVAPEWITARLSQGRGTPQQLSQLALQQQQLALQQQQLALQQQLLLRQQFASGQHGGAGVQYGLDRVRAQQQALAMPRGVVRPAFPGVPRGPAGVAAPVTAAQPRPPPQPASIPASLVPAPRPAPPRPTGVSATIYRSVCRKCSAKSRNSNDPALRDGEKCPTCLSSDLDRVKM